MSKLYKDIRRFLQLTDTQLDYVLAAWCRYRSADGGLVELLVDHVECLNGHDKEPYFRKVLEGFDWISDYRHHVKAISLASCKYNIANHPELLRHLLQANDHISLPVLLDTIEEQTETHEIHDPTANIEPN